MHNLILTSPGLPDQRIELLPGQLPVVLGRSRNADIKINDSLLSRKHSEIRLNDEGKFEIHDLDSTNLTIVNEHHIASRVLQSGDRIFLGDTEILVEVRTDGADFNERTTREFNALPE